MNSTATSKFRVVKRYPSILRQIAISKTEPGDEKQLDISTLVGKVDIRKLEQYSQDDADAYSYSGGLCLSNQGLPNSSEKCSRRRSRCCIRCLTATQEGNFKAPKVWRDSVRRYYPGPLNESELKASCNNKNNEALLDRIYIARCHIACGVGRNQDIRKLITLFAGQSNLRAGHVEDDGAVFDLTASG